MINITELLEQGQQALDKTRGLEEAGKLGILRGGNTGYMVGNEVRGSCARAAVLRTLGLDKTFDLSRHLMFAAGEYAENILHDRLIAAGANVLFNEDIATKWQITTTDGARTFDVTGRPDIVLGEGGVPTQGLEVKNLSSYYTMKAVTPFGEAKPKAPHLAQAAHYMWALGERYDRQVDWVLTYVSTNDWHNRYFRGSPDFVEVPAAYKDWISANKTKAGTYSITKINPFVVCYYLRLDEYGRLEYSEADDTQWHPTEITIDGIKQYYQLVADSVHNRVLPHRMINTDAHGQKLRWSVYDKRYNDYADLHKQYDAGAIDLDQFMVEAANITGI